MIPQVRGFQGCCLDNHRNNWRCARAVRALCGNAPSVIQKEPLALSVLHFPHQWWSKFPSHGNDWLQSMPASALERRQGAEAALVSRGTTVLLSPPKNALSRTSNGDPPAPHGFACRMTTEISLLWLRLIHWQDIVRSVLELMASYNSHALLDEDEDVVCLHCCKKKRYIMESALPCLTAYMQQFFDWEVARLDAGTLPLPLCSRKLVHLALQHPCPCSCSVVHPDTITSVSGTPAPHPVCPERQIRDIL